MAASTASVASQFLMSLSALKQRASILSCRILTIVAASSRKPSALRVAYNGTTSFSYMRLSSSMAFVLFFPSPRNRRTASRPTASSLDTIHIGSQYKKDMNKNTDSIQNKSDY